MHVVDKLWNEGKPATLAVNGTSLACYGSVTASLKSIDAATPLPSATFHLEHVKFTVVDIPYDVIVGRPTMAQHDMFSKLEEHFKEAAKGSMIHKVEPPMDLVQLHALRTHDLNAANNSVVPAKSLLSYEELADIGIAERDDAPWDLPQISSNDIDPLSLITIEGTDTLRAGLQALIQEFGDVFRTTVAPEPADLPPMVLQVNATMWQTSKNAGPPRVQGMLKQAPLVVFLR
jgi:DNA-directed RNA polymerase subunit H (RpoH/RPB5)